MTERARVVRNGLICALIFTACFWISWPIAQMGFIDDWSFIKTAQIFAQTGHMVYNGWSGPMLGWQVLWGALFIRLFGFSFMAVKLSTLPIAIATIFLFYLIEVRFGISPRNAVLGALTLGLSPMFLPLAASFMTDVPSLFVFLLCLYYCQRALASRHDASTIAWLFVAAASNVAGGTVRQIAWLGALVMLPSAAWLLRKRRRVLLAALLLWAASVACVFYLMHWYAAQPYSIPESLSQAPSRSLNHPIVIAFLYSMAGLLCLLLVIFPVLAAWLPRILAFRGAGLLGIGCILLLCVLLQFVADWTLPWLPYLLVAEFSVANIGEMSPHHGPFVFPMWARLLFSVFIAAAFLALLSTVRAHFRSTKDFWHSLADSAILCLLMPFTFSYCGLLFLHATHDGGIFDRYVLGVMPVGIILLIRLYEARIAPRLPALSAAMLAFYALLAIVGTHDWFATQRARLTAINELRAAGIPRTSIQGSFEYDSWTQIDNGGHIYGTGAHIPPSVTGKADHAPRKAGPCTIDYARLTSLVHPTYTVAFPPRSCLVGSKYPPVHYRAWLPPFKRTIYLQQFPGRALRMAADPASRISNDN